MTEKSKKQDTKVLSKSTKNTKTLKSGKSTDIFLRPFFTLSAEVILIIIIYNLGGLLLAFSSFIFVLIIDFCLCKSLLKNTVAAIVLFSLMFSFLSVENKIQKADMFNGKTVTLNLTVCSDAEKGNNYNFIRVKCNDSSFYYKNQPFFLCLRKGKTVECGRKIRATVYVFKGDKESRILSLKRNSVYGTFFLKSFEYIEGKNSFYSFCGKARAFVKKTFLNNLSYESFSTLMAIMLGDKSYLTDDFSLKIRLSGVSHIMVVSGMHLSVIMTIVLFAVDRFLKNRFIRFFTVSLCVFLICGICGFTVSVIRAGVMFIISSLAVMLGRDRDNLNTIGFTVTVILLFSPLLLFNISFQLSVIAVFSVMCISPFYIEKFKKLFGSKNLISDYLIETSVVSVIAEIFTLPIIIYNFGLISLAAPFTNIFLSAVITFLFAFSVSGLLLCFLPAISGVLFLFSDLITKYINFIIEFFGSLPSSAVEVDTSLFFLPITVIALLIFYMLLSTRREPHCR